MEGANLLRTKLTLTNNEALVDMFDDILHAYNSRLEDALYLKEQMLHMATHFEKTRKSYVCLYDRYQTKEEDAIAAEKKSKQLSSKYNHVRSQLSAEIEEKEELQRTIEELENTLDLMKEIVFDNSNNANMLQLDTEQRSKLVRACSLRASIRSKTPQKRRIAKVEETMEDSKLSMSDMSYDNTMNESLKEIPIDESNIKLQKPSVDDVQMASIEHPASNSTVSTDSPPESLDAVKKTKYEITCDSGNEVTTRVRGPAVLTINEGKRKSSGRTVRATGHAARRRQSRTHRQSLVVQHNVEKGEDSFFTPVSTNANISKRNENTNVIQNAKAHTTHQFGNKRCVTIETCRACFKRVKFSKTCLKCSTCRMIIHPECQEQLTIACSNPERKPASSISRQNLENFLLDKNASPKIPPQIYLTVHSVDERLTTVGVYRISGSCKQVQDLKKCLLYGNFSDVDFESIDVHVLTSFIKDFFRDQLNEPILTYKLLPKFIENTATSSESELKSLYRKLPEANQDTLAFFAVHLQNVIGSESKNRMNIQALARSVGPSIVGYPSEQPSIDEIRNAVKYQEEIIMNLLSLPRSFFNSFISGQGNRTTDGSLSNNSE